MKEFIFHQTTSLSKIKIRGKEITKTYNENSFEFLIEKSVKIKFIRSSSTISRANYSIEFRNQFY